MTMHWRTGLDLLPVLMVCAALAAFGAVALVQSEEAFGQIQAINRKLNAAQNLETAAANYGLRVGQVLQRGREQQEDLRAARLDMERGFIRLTQEARDQAATAPGGSPTRDLLLDVENTRRMLELYHAIDLSAARAFVLARDGDDVAAWAVYDRDVDFRLTTEFAALLDDAIAGEEARLAPEQAAWGETLGRMTAIGAGLLVALAAAIGLSWWLIARSVSAGRPGLAAEFEARAEELRGANRRLRETDTRRAEFLADVSHELRTPLTILRGEADVALLPGAKSDEQRRSLERIQDQAAELGQLLDDLIAFARSDGEAQPLVVKPVLLDDVLDAAVEEGETLAEPREVTIGLTIRDQGQWVDADMRRLKQALIIGIDNAINHSPPGSKIDVEMARTTDSVRTTILDHGPGLAGSDQQRVFDRFYRGANVGNSFGLGIGLAIAKGIIDQHDGTISLSNRPEGGAILTIDLPLPKGAQR